MSTVDRVMIIETMLIDSMASMSAMTCNSKHTIWDPALMTIAELIQDHACGL